MSHRTSQIVGEPLMLHMHIAMPRVLGPGTLRTFNVDTMNEHMRPSNYIQTTSVEDEILKAVQDYWTHSQPCHVFTSLISGD